MKQLALSKHSLLLILLFLMLNVWPAAAQDNLSLEAQIGFDSFYKSEYWTPIQVTLANNGPPIDGEVRLVVNPGNPDRRLIYRTPINLPTQSNKRITLYADLPDQANNNLTVELANASGAVLAETVIQNRERVPAEDLLYGVLSPDPGEFSFLENVTSGRADAAVAFLQLEDLPSVAVAWNALDILILNDVDSAQLTPDQRQALDVWVRTGGQIIITGGANWQKTTAVFQDILPVTINSSESVDDLPALSEEMGFPFRDPGPYIISNSSLSRGELLFHENGQPVLAGVPLGRGTVYFLALDPRFAPLLDWDGTEAIFTAVANRIPAVTLWGSAPQNSYSASRAVTNLPELNLPAVWQMAFFLLLYIIVVGPVNYFVLKRRNRLEWAWATIPLLILGFTAFTYFTGFQLRGNKTILNQMSVAYSQADGQQARIHSLLGLYSPRRTNYDLIYPADTLARPFQNRFGGNFDGNAGVETITYSSNNSMEGIRVDVSDVATFSAQTDRPAIPVSAQGTLNLVGNQVRLDMTVQNNSQIELEEGTLLLGSTAVPLGNFAPGQTETISQIISAGASSSFGSVTPTSPRSPLSDHAAVILGSKNYYDDRVLHPRYQFLEALEGESMSGAALSLPSDTAVLLAWSDENQIEFTVNPGQSKQSGTTLYFIEIPLQQNIVSSGRIQVPKSLLNWSLLDDSGLYDPASTYLDLTDGWAEFEFQPWLEFQEMQVETLAVMLEEGSNAPSILPEVRLWHWDESTWDILAVADWGETAVPNPSPYIGPNNTIRIRLKDNARDYGRTIQAVYPILSGRVD
ncbi:MAG: hypothetical protein GY796_29415 [Chloroflexi bacterium]|nr:hypothetical protein [Chloroflexota bacterium]